MAALLNLTPVRCQQEETISPRERAAGCSPMRKHGVSVVINPMSLREQAAEVIEIEESRADCFCRLLAQAGNFSSFV